MIAQTYTCSLLLHHETIETVGGVANAIERAGQTLEASGFEIISIVPYINPTGIPSGVISNYIFVVRDPAPGDKRRVPAFL